MSQKHLTAHDHFQAGMVLHRNNRLNEAVAAYKKAVRLDPTLAAAYNNLGVALRKMGRQDAALVAYRRCLELKPEDEGLWSNMGNCLRELQLFDEAEAAHKRALSLQTPNASRIFNAALVHRDRNEIKTAVALFDKALTLDPDYVEAHWDRALALLTLGDYPNGWAGYEWRRKLPDNPVRTFPAGSEWDGRQPLEGKTLLLSAEQGFGDMIQFARFVPGVAERAEKIIVECREELMPVMSTLAGVDQVIAKQSAPPAFDYHLPLLSLPYRLGTALAELPDRVPYLSPPLGERRPVPVPPGCRLKVGLIWAGKLVPRDRSCPLKKFLPLMRYRDAAFYSFQIDERRRDIKELGMDGLIIDLADEIHDFGDSAALMMQMDLILTIDSSPVHLAGALGLPVWMVALYTTDWRWLTDREDSPWYPTLRLFRQHAPGNWDEAFKKVEAQFATLVKARRQQASFD